VYLEVVPLVVEAGGGLRIGGSGPPADWLVKMRRLPAERMLDRRIALGTVTRAEVEPAAALLASFYAKAVPARVDAAGYLRHLRRGIRADRDELTKEMYGLPADDVLRVAEEQLRYTRQNRDTVADRVSSGRVVEGHGDLRPEHICLTEPPVVIDCLEFSRDLRMLDPLDELGFLALECARLGAPAVGEWFMDVYRRATGDAPPADLLRFYRRFRALRRA
jgi:aminoglycoside phosphotransferase family enzyme